MLANNLDMGHSIELGDFATLRPGIRAKAQDNASDANTSTVYRRKVNFVPGKMLSEYLNNISVTRMDIIDSDYTDNTDNVNP